MVHGTKDYGNVQQKKTTYRLDDMAELAVRLGSPDTFDRLGEIIFMDNFTDGFERWVQYLSGAGSAASITTKYFSTGGFSVELITGTTLNKKAQINHVMPYSALSKMGLEAAFSSAGYIPVYKFTILITSGTNSYWGIIDYTPSTERIRYADIDANWVVLAENVDLFWNYYNFHKAKLVVDFENKVYVRFVLDEKVYSMKDIPLTKIVEATDPRLEAIISVYHSGGVNAYGYIDDIIITQNEV